MCATADDPKGLNAVNGRIGDRYYPDTKRYKSILVLGSIEGNVKLGAEADSQLA
jgi:hypothetical protein